jgi:TonB family protein
MCCKGFWKRIGSFGLALSLGLLIVSVLQTKSSVNTNQIKPVAKVVYSNEGSSASGCCNTRDYYYPNSQEKPSIISHLKRESVRILSKPRADYTDEARLNQVQGKVVLRVVFSAGGQIGVISTISGLPDGLTEQAIAAARGIKFKPATRNGTPYSVTKPVEYTFTID